MLCEQANPQLIEYLANELPPEAQRQVHTHVQDCATCQSDLESIKQFHMMAENWQDEVVPNWDPNLVRTRQKTSADPIDFLRMWFPTAASAAALAMVTLIFFQMPATNNGTLPQQSTVAAQYNTLPQLPQATPAAQEAALVQSVMEGSREQRAEELQALLQILKAEMDRRSIETEESMRFIIANQLQGQQELDELYQQMEDIITQSAGAKSAAEAVGSNTAPGSQ
jgi:hypothetical protein